MGIIKFTRNNALIDKFNSRCFPDPNTGCYLWFGYQDRDGYGAIQTSDSLHEERAHRVSYKLFKGPIPKGFVVMHTCDNPIFVNPDHLKIGTQKDNIYDCMSKGRRGGNFKRYRNKELK